MGRYVAGRASTSGWSLNQRLDFTQWRHRFRSSRYGHRHCRRQAEAHFRGISAGRWHHQSQIRRHGLGLSISREIARTTWRKISLLVTKWEHVFTLYQGRGREEGEGEDRYYTDIFQLLLGRCNGLLTFYFLTSPTACDDSRSSECLIVDDGNLVKVLDMARQLMVLAALAVIAGFDILAHFNRSPSTARNTSPSRFISQSKEAQSATGAIAYPQKPVTSEAFKRATDMRF